MGGEVELSRRGFLKATAVTAGTSGFLSEPAAAEAGQWAMFGHDLGNHRYNPDADLAGDSVAERWMLSIGAPAGSEVIVVDETIYFTDESSLTYRVTPDGDTTTYQAGVSTDSDENGTSAPAPIVAEGQMYLGGLNGTLTAIDLDTGDTEWSYETESSVSASPTIQDDRLYLGCSEGVVYAIDRTSGDEVWRYQTGQTITNAPCLLDETLIAASQDGRIHAVALSSGNGETITEVDGRIHAAPVADNGRVYIASDQGEIQAVDTETADIRWTRTLDGSVSGTPTLRGDELYVGTSSGTVAALDITSGDSTWTTTVTGGIQTGLATAADVLLVGTDRGEIVAFDSDERDELWRFNAGTPISTPLTVAGDLLYFGTENGSVYAITSEAGLLYTAQSVASDTASSTAAAIPFDISPVEIAVGGIGGIGGALGLGYAGLRARRSRSNGDSDTDSDHQTQRTTVSGTADPIRSEEAADTSPTLTLDGVTYDDFKQQRQIGSGGSANVYEAIIDVDGETQTVALKTPRVDGNSTVATSSMADFVDEAEIWESIDAHERIVSVYGWGEEPLPWIAMEYMEGGTLNEQQSPLEMADVFGELESLCEALHHAHRHGITHTDIKPENILFTQSAPEGIGKFSDWGLANVLLDHSMSVHGLTPDYSAPEQIQPEAYGGTDDRTDIYQMGVVAYELFTGQRPHMGSSHGEVINEILNEEPTVPSELDPDLPEGLDEVILTAIAKQKDNRYETALHFRDDLRRAYHSN